MFELQKDYTHINVQKTIRFTEELDERLRTVCRQYNISFNKLVLQCCQYALDHLKEENDG